MTPPTKPAPRLGRGQDGLGDGKHEQGRQRDGRAAEQVLHRRRARAHDLGQPDRDEADERAGDDHPAHRRQRHARPERLRPLQEGDVGDRGEPRQDRPARDRGAGSRPSGSPAAGRDTSPASRRARSVTKPADADRDERRHHEHDPAEAARGPPRRRRRRRRAGPGTSTRSRPRRRPRRAPGRRRSASGDGSSTDEARWAPIMADGVSAPSGIPNPIPAAAPLIATAALWPFSRPSCSTTPSMTCGSAPSGSGRMNRTISATTTPAAAMSGISVQAPSGARASATRSKTIGWTSPNAWLNGHTPTAVRRRAAPPPEAEREERGRCRFFVIIAGCRRVRSGSLRVGRAGHVDVSVPAARSGLVALPSSQSVSDGSLCVPPEPTCFASIFGPFWIT